MVRTTQLAVLLAILGGCSSPTGGFPTPSLDASADGQGADGSFPEVDLSDPADAGADVDAIVADAGNSDASSDVDADQLDMDGPDASDSDAGTSPDAGESDAGEIDGAESDAASLDAGIVDGGSADAGAIDAGDVDAALDAGVLDAGTPDSGSEPDLGAADAGEVIDAGLDAGEPMCSSGERLCAGICSSCPTGGVATTECVGALCVAATCGDGFFTSGSSCASSSARTYGPAARSPLRKASVYGFGYGVAITHDRSELLVTGLQGSPGGSGTSVFVYASSGAFFSTLPFQELDRGVTYEWGSALSIDIDERNQTLAVGERGGGANLLASASPGYASPAYQSLYAFERDNQSIGSSVAISTDGNTLFVGDRNHGPRSDSSTTDGAEGAVFIYVKGATGFPTTPTQYIDAPRFSGDFGTSLAVSRDGNILFVGDEIYGGIYGAVHLYARLPSGDYATVPFQTLTGPDMSRLFGASIAVSESGDLLMVGDTDFGLTVATDHRGAVHLFAREDVTYASLPYQTILAPAESSSFGSSIALTTDGSLLVIGDSTYGTDGAGAVLFYSAL